MNISAFRLFKKKRYHWPADCLNECGPDNTANIFILLTKQYKVNRNIIKKCIQQIMLLYFRTQAKIVQVDFAPAVTISYLLWAWPNLLPLQLRSVKINNQNMKKVKKVNNCKVSNISINVT